MKQHKLALTVNKGRRKRAAPKHILVQLGYRVTTRTSSIEALELFRAKPDEFNLVVTDMTMPNMTGDELTKELIRIKPEIPIIICTGYSARINQEQALAMGIHAFVMKPVVKGELAVTIRKVLDQKVKKDSGSAAHILIVDDDGT